MEANILEKMGTKLASYTFHVEKGKIKELALAIGDLKGEYLIGEKVPPTFPTVIEFWAGEYSPLVQLELNMEKVLHGEQTYEYIGEMKADDEIAVHTTVEDVYTKSAMNFYILKKEFINQNGELVLRGYSTIIERH